MPLAPGHVPYLLVHLVAVTVGTVWLLWVEKTATVPWLFLLATLLLWATWSWAQISHRTSTSVAGEIIRLVVTPAAVGVLLWSTNGFVPGVAIATGLSLVSIPFLLFHRRTWTDRAGLDTPSGTTLLPPPREHTAGPELGAVPGK